MEYYIVLFLYKKQEYYFIWTTSENDEFLTDDNKIIFWRSLEEVKKFADNNNIVLAQDEEIIYDVDVCMEWCCSASGIVDCNVVLGLWNIFLDLHNTVGKAFVGDREEFDKIYEKLFYGNNLPTINPTGEKYIPSFSEDEIALIKKLLKGGINMLWKTVH